MLPTSETSNTSTSDDSGLLIAVDSVEYRVAHLVLAVHSCMFVLGYFIAERPMR